MSEIVPSGSSFETLKQRDDRGEFWMARDLMVPADYSNWQNFQRAINDARTAMTKEGYDLSEHFSLASIKTSGRPSTDWRLSRLACKFVFMNGDPRKDAIAAAQAYFAEQTTFAERVQAAPMPMRMPTLPEALRAWANEVEAREKAELKAAHAESQIEELRPPAEAWEHLADTGQDYDMATAASILNRDPIISTGRDRLRDWMIDKGMMYRKASGQLVPYAEHLGHLRLKPQFRPDSDAEEPGTFKEALAQVRVTVKGLSWIQQRMRNEAMPELLMMLPKKKPEPLPKAEADEEPPVDFERYRREALLRQQA